MVIMKKYLKECLCTLLLLVCVLSMGITISAASTTKKKAVYTMKTYSKTLRGPYATGKYSFKLPQLEGSSSVVEKINKSLKKEYTASKKQLEYFKSCVEGARFPGSFIYTTSCKATFNERGYVSFCFTTEWFAGGVHNSHHYGASYNLKTGNKLALKNVVKNASTDSKVKKVVVDAYYKKLGKSYATKSQLSKSISVSRLYFYLKNGYVYVSCGSYAPCGGNGEVLIKLNGRY